MPAQAGVDQRTSISIMMLVHWQTGCLAEHLEELLEAGEELLSQLPWTWKAPLLAVARRTVHTLATIQCMRHFRDLHFPLLAWHPCELCTLPSTTPLARNWAHNVEVLEKLLLGPESL